MGNWSKIKDLRVLKKKSFLMLLDIEILLLTVGIIGLFGKNKVYEYGIGDMTVLFGNYDEERTGYGVESGCGQQGNMVDFENIVLPKGVYRVEMHYETDVDYKQSCQVTSSNPDSRTVRVNDTALFSGLKQTAMDMWVLRENEPLTVHAYYSGEGSLLVQGLTIRQTNGLNRICLFVLVCLFLCVNLVYVYVLYDKTYCIPVKNKTVTFLLGMIILGAALPVTADYILSGADIVYHLLRVEGIADGLRAGQFPIRISPEWQQGYGYASPIFYGETILYLEALFRLIGFTVTTSYRLFQLMIAAATVLTAYFCYKKIFREAYIGVFCSMLYSLSVNRIYKLWIRGAIGEALGIMLLPVFVYGFYRVFTQDVQEESYKRSWLPLTAGFSLLIQSHLLTGELVGLFTVFLCLFLWKKVFRRQTFFVLAKTVIYSMLLSAWFLIPFADYMSTGAFVINNVSARTIQARGLYPAHLLFTFFKSGGTVFFDEKGMYDTAPMGVGIVLIGALVLFVFLWLSGRLNRLEKKERGLGIMAGGFSILSMWMSLSLFPWDRIQAINSFTATLVSSIQFPDRFLTISTVCLTTLAGVCGKYILDHCDKRKLCAYFVTGEILLTMSSFYLMDNMLASVSGYRIYNHEGMGTGYISGGEYLPYGADASRFVWHDPVCSGMLMASHYEKKSLGASAHMINNGETTEHAAFSLLYYRGYHAYEREEGGELPCYAGDNFEVTVDIPAGFAGDIDIRFISPWYWRAAELVTGITLLIMLLFFGRKRMEKRV